MTGLVERRRQALDNPHVDFRLKGMRLLYEAGFAKISKMEMPASLSLSFGPHPSIEAPPKIFEHREILGKGDTFEAALADWRGWLDKCPQSGKELIWRVPPEVDCFCDFPTDRLIWKVYARLIIIPEEPEMTDITNKLEYIAGFRGICKMRLEPSEVDNIAQIGAEALAEIQRLRLDLAYSNAMRYVSQPVWPVSSDTYTIAVDRSLSGKTATQVIIDDPHEPAPEPWGSDFAMNTENWK